MIRLLLLLLLCECLVNRDIIPVRIGLRFVGRIADESLELLLSNKTFVHDPLCGDVFPEWLGLDVGDFGGLRLIIFSFTIKCGLTFLGEICSLNSI